MNEPHLTKPANPSGQHASATAVVAAAKALVHWSSLFCVLAVVPVAYWVGEATSDASWMPGVVFAGSFAVFALLLPTLGLLREFIDRRMRGLDSLLAAGSSESRLQLEGRRDRLASLASSVAPLERGVVLAVVAALLAAAAIVVPPFSIWDRPPALFASTPADVLSAAALVALVAAVVDMFPFTWHLLVTSDQLRFMSDAIDDRVRALEPRSPEVDRGVVTSTHASKTAEHPAVADTAVTMTGPATTPTAAPQSSTPGDDSPRSLRPP